MAECKSSIQIAEFKEIVLSQGTVSVVDASDYEWLNQWKWSLAIRKSERQTRYYAFRNVRTNVGSTVLYMHRALLNAPRGVLIDHRDGNGLNNQHYNLRLCNKTQNAANSKKQPGRTSRHKGVCWNKVVGKWAAYIKCGDKHLCLGFFDSEDFSAITYANEASKMFGEFAHV